MVRRLSDYGLLSFAALSSMVALALFLFGQTQDEQEIADILSSDSGVYDSSQALQSSSALIQAQQRLGKAITAESRAEILQLLDSAYSQLDQPSYREKYSCVPLALAETERIIARVSSQSEHSAQHQRAERTQGEAWSRILGCQLEVITGQERARDEIAQTLIERSILNKHGFTVAIVLTYLLGIGLWIFHERQRLKLISMLREKLRWQRRAETDHLTGAYNRRALEEALENLVDNHERPRTLVMLYDIDHFKAYNDYYGHVMGDEVIKRVVSAIDQVLRAEDRQFRYGGEEFVVLSELSPQQDPEPIAQRTLEAIQKLAIAHEKSPKGIITISLGCYQIRDEDSDPEAIIKSADWLLYRAKSEGRNQFCLGTPD